MSTKINQNPASKKSGLKGSFPKGGGGSTNNGLAFREGATGEPEALGMGTSGPNQKPIGPAKGKASGSFEFA